MKRWMILFGKEEQETKFTSTLFEALRFVYYEHIDVEILHESDEHYIFIVNNDEIIELFRCYYFENKETINF